MKLNLNFFKNNLDNLDSENQTHHVNSIKGLLKKVFPSHFFKEDGFNESEINKAKLFLNETLPIVKWSKLLTDNNLSILLMCKHRKDASNFFYDMVSRYLIAQKSLNIELFFSADFILSELSDDKFTIIEAIVNIGTLEDLKIIEKNKRSFETEIRLGIASDFHANRIREFKGLSNDRKTALVQEKIGSLMQKRPKEFGKNIFSEMQQFLIMSRDEFKSQRDYHHISRIISILYMIRKLLKQNIELLPNKRHVILKFLKTRLKKSNRDQIVLGVLVGLNFLKEHEVFEQKHLIKAIKNYVPNAVAIDNSFFMDKAAKNFIQTCYIEVKKENSENFSNDEIGLLKEELPIFLKGNIEQLIHPIFMPRNEEEIVKNMVTLSHQLKYVHDIPQVIISFDKQTSMDFAFNIILLRVLRPSDVPLKELFSKIKSKFRFLEDRVKKVGIIRRKYLKEANVLRVFVPSSSYLRSDHSLDINRARQDIVEELVRLFGDVRDYNGGMIHKQNEAYKDLQSLLGQVGLQNEALLEKYFYSIVPVEMTAIVKLDVLKNLFLMLINAIKREETRIKKHSDFLFKQDFKHMYIIIPVYDQQKKKIIKESMECLNILSSELVSFYLTSHDIPYLGYVLINEDKEKQKAFFDIIKKCFSS